METSFIVVYLPKLIRMVPLISSWFKPIDFKTCEGSSLSEVQAEPFDNAIVFMPKIILSASKSGRHKLMIPGNVETSSVLTNASLI